MKKVALLALLFATPAWAQPSPESCVSTLDELGELIRDLDGVDRDDLVSKLVSVVSDPALRGACEKDEVRYDAATKLHELALAAPASARGPIVDALLDLASKETDLLARRAMVLNLDRMELTGAQQEKAKALAEEFLPSSPHYPTVFGENGDKTTVNVVVHTANAENRFDYYKRTFRGATMTERDGNLHIEYKVTPDDPTGRLKPVTYKILVKDERRGSTSNFDIFDSADSDDPAVEVFNYHSNYGSSLSRSIENGAAGPGSKKIFFLGNCKSHVNAGRIAARWPNMHGFYTIDSQYMTDTPPTLKRLLTELVNRPTWRQIDRAMDYANLLQTGNYLMPDDRRLLAHLDTDFDGIPDSHDTGADCGLVATEQDHELRAKRAPADAGRLNGEKIGYAIDAANGILGYSEMADHLAGKFVADGWAPADPRAPKFTFTRDGDQVKVKVNAAYSHLSDTALAGAALREMVMFEASKNGRTPTKDDEILAYAMGVKLFDAWSANQGGAEAYREFQKAYSLGRDISLYEAAGSIDHDRGVTTETIAWFKERLGGS